MFDIQEQGCNLAIWKRSLPFNPEPLLADETRGVRCSVAANNPAPILTQELQAAGFTASESLDRLITDICRLCDMFQPVADTPNIEVRVEVVTNNACRKFHGDYVSARLITTYTGPGTEWLDNDDAMRVDQGHEPHMINQMAAGDVGIFKGRLVTEWPAIHRSPPIEGTGAARLIVVLNPESDQES
ncbi:DUF1826 domain-containing protein [Alterisphingorhabdus coralli]|uniref:DUF1826 domain-containing protein n=1 Tax=Alterisphingorhabdus coralli TaxID=3071408 RepID=A0AA97F4H5_9SPHN|nr:DUF1826 domain-containing protein [Parasphingorhabdus sp. SCSIO 66989]WOE73876.1 DUF1826 domain-containing protein [Parasphingorhabdus sp. SCSIO 66989]